MVFFSSLAMIYDLPSIFFAFGNFHFWPYGKNGTCLTPIIMDFGHWFWKIGRDAHNLQPLNGLIKKNKKQKRWQFPIGAQLCDWLILPNMSKSKGRQTTKFDQLIEYNMRNIFVEKSYTKCAGETISRPLSKYQNWAYLWINSVKF